MIKKIKNMFRNKTKDALVLIVGVIISVILTPLVNKTGLSEPAKIEIVTTAKAAAQEAVKALYDEETEQ